MPLPKEIRAYHSSLPRVGERRICEALASAIDARLSKLPHAESKLWHAHPVWFLDGNPIVGYSKLKTPAPHGCIRLLFWSGQSFDEQGLQPEGTFQAADVRFTSVDAIVARDLRRWLDKAIEIQWDYKNLIKRKGKLLRLKPANEH